MKWTRRSCQATERPTHPSKLPLPHLYSSNSPMNRASINSNRSRFNKFNCCSRNSNLRGNINSSNSSSRLWGACKTQQLRTCLPREIQKGQTCSSPSNRFLTAPPPLWLGHSPRTISMLRDKASLLHSRPQAWLGKKARFNKVGTSRIRTRREVLKAPTISPQSLVELKGKKTEPMMAY